MPESGIDWDHYDHGPGSEEWKRKMAAEKQGFLDRLQTVRRRQMQRLKAKAAGRAETAKRLWAELVHRLPPDDMRAIPDYGDHLLLAEFLQDVRERGFVDSDGNGYLATDSRVSRLPVRPSSICTTVGTWPPAWATHVMWFNK